MMTTTRLGRSAGASWLLAAPVAAALYAPLVGFWLDGLSLVGLTEEGVGYRYFYTLRMLYGEERPWLFFGHLIGVVHLVLQVVLTGLGYSPTELVPRIDHFAYLAAGIPHALTAAALAWAVRPIANGWARLGLAGLYVALAYSSRDDLGDHLISTKYYAWVHPVALVTLGWLIRLGANLGGHGSPTTGGRALTVHSAFALGLFAGASGALKPSYLLFPIVVGAACASVAVAGSGSGTRPVGNVAGGSGDPGRVARAAQAAGWLCLVGATGMASWVLLTWVYYLGHWPAVANSFHIFVLSSTDEFAPPEPPARWLATRILDRPPDMTTVATLLPLILAAGATRRSARPVTIAMLLGALAYDYVAYRRPSTTIETDAYAFVALASWFVLAALPTIPRPRHLRGLSTGLVVGFGVAAWLLAMRGAVGFIADFRPLLIEANAGGSAVGAFVEGGPGVTLFLIPTNAERPLTIDAALQKGGMDANTQRWGDSPYVASLVPTRRFVVGAGRGAPRFDLADHERVVFAALPGEDERVVAILRLHAMFGVDLTGYACPLAVPLRNRAERQIVYGCERPK